MYRSVVAGEVPERRVNLDAVRRTHDSRLRRAPQAVPLAPGLATAPTSPRTGPLLSTSGAHTQRTAPQRRLDVVFASSAMAANSARLDLAPYTTDYRPRGAGSSNPSSLRSGSGAAILLPTDDRESTGDISTAHPADEAIIDELAMSLAIQRRDPPERSAASTGGGALELFTPDSMREMTASPQKKERLARRLRSLADIETFMTAKCCGSAAERFPLRERASNMTKVLEDLGGVYSSGANIFLSIRRVLAEMVTESAAEEVRVAHLIAEAREALGAEKDAYYNEKVVELFEDRRKLIAHIVKVEKDVALLKLERENDLQDAKKRVDDRLKELQAHDDHHAMQRYLTTQTFQANITLMDRVFELCSFIRAHSLAVPGEREFLASAAVTMKDSAAQDLFFGKKASDLPVFFEVGEGGNSGGTSSGGAGVGGSMSTTATAALRGVTGHKPVYWEPSSSGALLDVGAEGHEKTGDVGLSATAQESSSPPGASPHRSSAVSVRLDDQVGPAFISASRKEVQESRLSMQRMLISSAVDAQSTARMLIAHKDAEIKKLSAELKQLMTKFEDTQARVDDQYASMYQLQQQQQSLIAQQAKIIRQFQLRAAASVLSSSAGGGGGHEGGSSSTAGGGHARHSLVSPGLFSGFRFANEGRGASLGDAIQNLGAAKTNNEPLKIPMAPTVGQPLASSVPVAGSGGGDGTSTVPSFLPSIKKGTPATSASNNNAATTPTASSSPLGARTNKGADSKGTLSKLGDNKNNESSATDGVNFSVDVTTMQIKRPMTPRPMLSFQLQSAFGIQMQRPTEAIVTELTAVALNLKGELDEALIQRKKLLAHLSFMDSMLFPPPDVVVDPPLLPTLPSGEWASTHHFLRTHITPNVPNAFWNAAFTVSVVQKFFEGYEHFREIAQLRRDFKMVEPRRIQLQDRRKATLMLLDVTEAGAKASLENIPVGYVVTTYFLYEMQESMYKHKLIPTTAKAQFAFQGEDYVVELELAKLTYNFWHAVRKFRHAEPICDMFLQVLDGQLPVQVFELSQRALAALKWRVISQDIAKTGTATYAQVSAAMLIVTAEQPAANWRQILHAVVQTFRENDVPLTGRIPIEILFAAEKNRKFGEFSHTAPRQTGSSLLVKAVQRVTVTKFLDFYAVMEALLMPLACESALVGGVLMLRVPDVLRRLRLFDKEYNNAQYGEELHRTLSIITLQAGGARSAAVSGAVLSPASKALSPNMASPVEGQSPKSHDLRLQPRSVATNAIGVVPPEAFLDATTGQHSPTPSARTPHPPPSRGDADREGEKISALVEPSPIRNLSRLLVPQSAAGDALTAMTLPHQRLHQSIVPASNAFAPLVTGGGCNVYLPTNTHFLCSLAQVFVTVASNVPRYNASMHWLNLNPEIAPKTVKKRSAAGSNMASGLSGDALDTTRRESTASTGSRSTEAPPIPGTHRGTLGPESLSATMTGSHRLSNIQAPPVASTAVDTPSAVPAPPAQPKPMRKRLKGKALTAAAAAQAINDQELVEWYHFCTALRRFYSACFMRDLIFQTVSELEDLTNQSTPQRDVVGTSNEILAAAMRASLAEQAEQAEAGIQADLKHSYTGGPPAASGNASPVHNPGLSSQGRLPQRRRMSSNYSFVQTQVPVGAQPDMDDADTE